MPICTVPNAMWTGKKEMSSVVKMVVVKVVS